MFCSWQNYKLSKMSSARVIVSVAAFERFRNLEKNTSVFLLGVSHCDSTYILGVAKQWKHGNNIHSNDLNNRDLNLNLPAGIDYCGVSYVSFGNTLKPNIMDDLSREPDIVRVGIIFYPTLNKIMAYLRENDTWTEVPLILVEKNKLLESFVHLRLTASLPISCAYHTKSVRDAIDFFHEKFLNGASGFRIGKSEVSIMGEKSNDIKGTSPETTLGSLYYTLKSDEHEENKSSIRVLDVRLYFRRAGFYKKILENSNIHFLELTYNCDPIRMTLDSLSVVPNELKVKQLYPILVKSALRNLLLNKESILKQIHSPKLNNIYKPEVYHFLPLFCGHFVTIAYSVNQTSDELKKIREYFHWILSLPLTTSWFRRETAYAFSASEERSFENLNINLHKKLPESESPDGETRLVQGSYAFYPTESWDVTGWTRAYRSLQTIFSWFRFQGYTDVAIPTIKEIINCLVQRSEKPGAFHGIYQFINSTDARYVLKTMLDVECKIEKFLPWEDMSQKGIQLLRHFKSNGTPVMIESGPMAHTIIGVNYNQKKNEVKYLVLEHFIGGGKDPKFTDNRRLCEWKEHWFWSHNYSFTLCLPIKPN